MYMLNSLLGLAVMKNSSPLNRFINYLLESKNKKLLENLNLKFDFLSEENYTNNFKNEEIIFYGLINSALNNKFLLGNSQNFFLNKKPQNYFYKSDVEKNLILGKLNNGNIKKLNFFTIIIKSLLKKIFRLKINIIYYNLLDFVKNPEDCYGNKLKKIGFNKIIDLKIFCNDFAKIYADKSKKNQIKILPNASNSCPEIDNYQSAFLILYKYFLEEKNNLLNVANPNKTNKNDLKKLKKFNYNEFKKLQKKFISNYTKNQKNTQTNSAINNFLEFESEKFKLESLEYLNLLVFIDFLNEEQSDRNFLYSDEKLLKFRVLRLIKKNKKAIRAKKSKNNKNIKRKISNSKKLPTENEEIKNLKKTTQPLIPIIKGMGPSTIVEPSNRPTKLFTPGGKANNFNSDVNCIIEDLKPNNPKLIKQSEEEVVCLIIEQLNNIQNKLKSKDVNFNSIDEVVDFTKIKLSNLKIYNQNKIADVDYKFEKISNQNVTNDNINKSINKDILEVNFTKNEVPSPSPRLIHVKVSFNANDLESLTSSLIENVGKWQNQIKNQSKDYRKNAKIQKEDRTICL